MDWLGSGNDYRWVSAQGFYVSVVSAAAYSSYERELFRGTLDDWGWFGAVDNLPSWFSGAPWS